MRSIRALAAVGASALLVAVVVTAATAATSPGPLTLRACTNGVADRIAGRTVCIHVGGKCLTSHNAKYRARGFVCVNGRLRRVRKAAVSVGDASIP
jgi:hypothetical protein